MPQMRENMFYKLTAIMGGLGVGWIDQANDYLRFVALIVSIIVGSITLIDKVKTWLKK